MKVLILTTIRAPYRVGLFNILGRRCELHVCFENEHEKGRDKKWYDNHPVNFTDIQLGRSVGGLKWEIAGIIGALKPDIAIAYEYSTITSWYFMTLCRKRKIPYLINCDGGFINHSFIKTSVKRYFIKGAAGFLAGGVYAGKYLEYYGAGRSRIRIHNFTSLYEKDILREMIPADEKKKIRRELGIGEEYVVVAVGQYIYRKGFDILIRACKNIGRNTGIYIIGGSATPEYRSLCETLSLDNIHFIEFQGDAELRKYYLSSDLAVLPTREDIWGLVINEAMACGLPVITTNRCVAGLELIQDDENGYIVDAEDTEQLSEKINRILSDSSLREKMSRNNLIKIADYTIESMAEKQFEFIKENASTGNKDNQSCAEGL